MLSMMTTESPLSSKASATCDPMKPAPPVTKTVLGPCMGGMAVSCGPLEDLTFELTIVVPQNQGTLSKNLSDSMVVEDNNK